MFVTLRTTVSRRFMTKSVNMHTSEDEPRDLVKSWYFRDSDPRVVAGLREFAAALTPAHSLTSRRYSIRSLVAKYVDVPFATALREYSGHWAWELLDGFLPSRAGCVPPRLTRLWQEVIPYIVFDVSSRPRACPAGTPTVDWQVGNIKQWEENVRCAIRSVTSPIVIMTPSPPVPTESRQPDPHTSMTRDCFCSTLDSIWEFLDFLTERRPDTGKDNRRLVQQSRERFPDEYTRPQDLAFCELCWRPTISSARRSRSDGPYSLARTGSRRFCRVHDPADPTSSYHADLPYRELFQHEQSLPWNELKFKSAYGFQFPIPHTGGKEQWRKRAYDLVHAFPRRSLAGKVSEWSLPERAWRLRVQGLRRTEISRKLGISRAAVTQAFKKLEEISQASQLEEELFPDTHEVFSLAPRGRPSQLFIDVATLEAAGLTTTQIARQLHNFKHTIKTVQRWLAAAQAPADAAPLVRAIMATRVAGKAILGWSDVEARGERVAG